MWFLKQLLQGKIPLLDALRWTSPSSSPSSLLCLLRGLSVPLVTEGWHRDFGDKWDSTNFSYISALGGSCCVGNQEGIPTCLLREAARKSPIPWEAALVTQPAREGQDRQKCSVGNAQLPSAQGEAHRAFKWHQHSRKARSICQSRCTKGQAWLPTANHRNL